MFVGILRSRLTCQVCHNVSESFEPFIDLSLPLDCSHASTTAGNGAISLLDCLQLFVQQELLDADNRPECERCKQRQRATKNFSIDHFPPILILHLKRFKQNGDRTSKLGTDVKCPMYKLDLTRFATDTDNTSAVYNLYAVCNHTGSANNGHYTAYARALESDRWYFFDDARVAPADSSAVVSSDAYLLFYELSETTSSRL